MPTETDNSQRGVPAKCASCNGPMESPAFCDHCRSLYPADGLSHFELLGFEPTYDLDAGALRQKYLQISRGVHPDRRDERDSTLSLRVSAQLNEAFRVLDDPVLRAEYLLELLGGKSAAQDKNVPPEVLSAALLLREEVQEAKTAGDTAALAACAARVREICEQELVVIGELARQLPGEDETRRKLRSKLNAMKYYQRVLAEL